MLLSNNMIDCLCFPQIRLKVSTTTFSNALWSIWIFIQTYLLSFRYGRIIIVFTIPQNIADAIKLCIYCVRAKCLATTTKIFFIKIYQKCVSFSLMLTHLLAMLHTPGEMQLLSKTILFSPGYSLPGDFLGGPVVKTPGFQCRGDGFHPWLVDFSHTYTMTQPCHKAKQCSNFSKPGFKSMWTMNFQTFKLDLEKAEEPENKLPASLGSSKKQENSRKTYISLLLIMPKPLTV